MAHPRKAQTSKAQINNPAKKIPNSPPDGNDAHLEKPAKSVNDFCRKYDISRTTVYAEMGSGALPYIQIRGLRRITPEGEANWLERKTVQPRR